MDWLWTFLGHGGFKLVIIALVAGGHLFSKTKKKDEGNSKNGPIPIPMPQRGQSRPTPPTSPLGSPWSNGNPFDDIKK